MRMCERKQVRAFPEESDRMPTRARIAPLMIRRATYHLSCLAVSALIISSTPVWAEDPTSIQQLLEEPKIYHLRHVTLRGIVRDVQALAPYTLPNGESCYGAYLFRLEEEEATIPVAVLGICGRPLVRDPEVEDGDHVDVSATIQAPSHGGYYLSFKGLQAATEQETVVQAVADRILPVVE